MAALFAAQAVAEPVQAKHRRKAKAPAPPCAFAQAATNGCGSPSAPPKQLQLDHDRSRKDDGRTKLIFDGPPKNALPFENDLSPAKKNPIGGSVGIEFPF